MEVRIGNNSEYLLLRNITLESLQNYFYNTTIEIHLNGFSSNIKAFGEINELTGLILNLKKLYQKLDFQFTFGNLEDNIGITVQTNPTNAGQIELKGFLKNSYGTGKLEFKIVTDQSYLPETINQLEIVLSDLKINTK